MRYLPTSWLQLVYRGVSFLLLCASSHAAEPPAKEETAYQIRTSLFSPTALVLRSGKNGFAQTSVTDLSRSIPGLHLGMSRHISQLGRVSLHSELAVGYRYLHILADIRTAGSDRGRHMVTQHWIPWTAGLRANYHIRGLDFVEPALGFGAGLNTVFQSGVDNSYRLNRFIPIAYGYIGLDFVFSNNPEEWFRSFSFGTSYLTNLTAYDRIQGWDLQLQFRFLL